MDRRSVLLRGGLAALCYGAAVTLLSSCGRTPQEKRRTIRLGWQSPWANQGQLVEILKSQVPTSKPNVAYFNFTFGAPMAEAGLAGKLDVLLLGDEPAMVLISKQSGWRIASRLVNYRSAFVTPPESNISSINGLRGKRIGTAIGSTTHRDAARILMDAGLNPGVDFTFVNIDQAEHSAVIAAGKPGAAAWDNIDAIATYDPTIVVAVSKGLAKVVSQWASMGVLLASADMMGNRKGELVVLLKALREAYVIYAREPELYDKLYIQDAHINLDVGLLRAQTEIDPNFSVRGIGQVRQGFSEADRDLISRNIAAAIKLKLLPIGFTIMDAVDDSAAQSLDRP